LKLMNFNVHLWLDFYFILIFWVMF
jgi:hypothetical protein